MTGATPAALSARDALLELVNIGSGNALSTLARMVGGRLMLSVPELVTAETLAGLDAAGLGVAMDVTGSVRCRMLVLFDEASATTLATTLLGRSSTTAPLGAIEESAVVEAVNIISCSFLGALATLLRGTLIPGPPLTRHGRLATLLASELAPDSVAVTDRFEATGGVFSGRVVLVMAAEATTRVLAAVGHR